MDEEHFDDLKQFIAGVVSQSESRLKQELASKSDLKRLEKKVDDGFAGIGDALDAPHTQLADHEQRITKLEEQAA